MIWLTWRQFRAQALAIGSAAVVLLVVLALTGVRLHEMYRADEAIFLSRIQFDRFRQGVYDLGLVSLFAFPAVIGSFWGAPLVARELESGTFRLVWTQSITRWRWLTTKVLGTGLLALAITGALSLAVFWWSSPIDHQVALGHGSGPFSLPRMSPLVFGSRALVPLACTALALAVGITAGILLRRSVPAIAVTLGAVVLIQLAMPLVVREHLVAPVRTLTAITAQNLQGMLLDGAPGGELSGVSQLRVNLSQPGAWELSNQTVDATGRAVAVLPPWAADCGPPQTPGGRADQAAQQACFTRLAREGYRQELVYQPAQHFWALQWREAGVLTLAAVLLTGFSFWRIRRLS